MHKILKFQFLILLLVLLGCNNDDDKETYLNYPECLAFEIDAIHNRPPSTIRASIKKYIYLEESVFVFYEGSIVDGQTRIYNKDCIRLCEIGGLDDSINTCENWESAEFIETLWTDDR